MKKLFFSLLAVAAMARCSKSELSDRPVIGQDNVEIFAKSTALGISTRTPFEGSVIDNDHQLEAKVWATTKKGDYSGTMVSGNHIPTYNGKFNNTNKMVFTDSDEVGFDTNSMYFPADQDNVYLFGLYPYDLVWTESTSSGATSAKTTIDGKSDIMVAPQVQASKSAQQAATPTYPTLAFEHMLTKLIVKVVAEDQAAIDGWGNVTDIQLTGAAGSLRDEITVQCADATPGSRMSATFGISSANPTSFNFFKMDGSVTPNTYSDDAFVSQTVALTTTATSVAYLLVAPLSNPANTTDDFSLAVKTANHTDAFPVKIELKDATGSDYNQSTQGKYFEITLTFKATEVQAKATVAAWENGGNGGADIQ
ncbi:MAG: fimbrillin family protein [Alistipes sp.]|nr:fimbrillin family protein [Alistipes sp.]